MAVFYNISDWNVKKYFQSGGTRNKDVVEDPETLKQYFFKTSLKKEGRDYKYEFWSEIIASKIGQALNFDVLDYNIAQKGEEVGCLSKLMNEENQSLFEAVNYLQGFDPNYLPENKDSKKQYTFQFICNALKHYSLEHQIENLIKTIIFDSLIGNGDRHQENWGFLIPDFLAEDKKSIPTINKLLKRPIFKKLIKVIARVRFFKKNIQSKDIDMLFKELESRYAPIYDNGSSLGRELDDKVVDLKLENSAMLDKYATGKDATSEIHWDGKKIKHFQLIENIYNQQEYKKIVLTEINRINSVFNEQKIRNIVYNIDENLPETLFNHKLPENRKELIIKIVSLRHEKLQSIIK